MIEAPPQCPLCAGQLIDHSLYTKNIFMCEVGHYDFYRIHTKKVASETYGTGDFYIFLQYTIEGTYRYGTVFCNGKTVRYLDNKPTIEDIKHLLRLGVLS